jgi:hypothetical protein
MANNGTFLPPISASPTRNHGLKTGMRSGVDASPTMAQRLVSDIIEIRANLDDIARRENKLRKAIHFFTVKRSGQDRCVSPWPLSRPDCRKPDGDGQQAVSSNRRISQLRVHFY